jgi:hypothetical protein
MQQQADRLDQDVHALKQWLDAAWRRLADPALTQLARRELRYQMRQSDAELRLCMQRMSARQQHPRPGEMTSAFPKPEFRFLQLRDPAGS